MTARAAAAGPALADLEIGSEIPEVALPITHTLVCLNAAATWDWFPGHHDPEYARTQGQPDIYLSTLFFHGFVDRAVIDWAGPDALVRRRKISMLRSIHPGQTATVRGRIVGLREEGGRQLVDLDLVVASEEGPCVPAEVTVELAAAGT